MKFLCDHMLIRLGKWLRAAGYDTSIVSSPLPDNVILNLALSENRFLISRDRHFLNMINAKSNLIYLKSNHLEECVKEFNEKISIDWLLRPFSRCMMCNSLFIKMAPQKINENVPEPIIHQKHEFWYCSNCDQFYWEGTHTKNMLAKLQKWQKDSKLFHSQEER